jgi:Protein of unknown function (DUF3108)
MKKILLSIGVLYSILNISAAPAWEKELTVISPSAMPPITPSKLEYTLSWKGRVDAGKTTIQFGLPNSDKNIFKASATGNSIGFAAKLFPYSFFINGKMNANDYSPINLHSNETDKKETISTFVEYSKQNVSFKEICRPHETGIDTINKSNFAYTPVFDVFSAMIHVRNQNLDDGNELVFICHPFKAAYLTKIKVLGRENINDRKAIKLDVKLTKIRKDFSLKKYEKMKTTTMWISDDKDRIPLEMRVEAFIGDVRMTLTNQEKL